MTHALTVHPFAPPVKGHVSRARRPIAEVIITWPGYNPLDAIRFGSVTPIQSVTYSHDLSARGVPIITAEYDAFKGQPLTCGDLYHWLSENELTILSHKLISQSRVGRWMGTYRLIIGFQVEDTRHGKVNQ